MKLLRQLGIIIGICFAGELIHKLFKIPVPGNVIGMVLLFLGLYTGIIKLHMIDEITRFLLDHLAFFFIPAGVGLLACVNLIQGKLAAILTITFITTIIVMVVTGHTVQILKRGKNK